MSKNPLPILDYNQSHSETRSNAGAWIIAFLAGIPAGYVLSFSAYGAVCVGIVFGFTIGLAAALAARYRKVRFGLVGNAIAAISCITFAMIANARAGIPVRLDEWALVIFFIFILLAGPGLASGALGAAVSVDWESRKAMAKGHV